MYTRVKNTFQPKAILAGGGESICSAKRRILSLSCEVVKLMGVLFI